MKLTVVVPTHNRALLLRAAIESVLASPLISEPDQVVIVDDDSTDGTPAVAAEFGTRYVRVGCGGPSGARNAGLALAEGEYVAFLDDDDVWFSGNMEEQLEVLDEHPECAFAYGRFQFTTHDLEWFGEPGPPRPLRSGLVPDFVYLNIPQIAVVLFRRKYLDALGGFDAGLRYGEDVDVMVRLASRHPVVSVDHVGAAWRQRPHSKQRADEAWAAFRSWRRTRWSREGPAWPLWWVPKGLGVTWRSAARREIAYRRTMSAAFRQDANACVRTGSGRDALVCLWRSLRVSPIHSLVARRSFWGTLGRCLVQA
jgi:glycosyltransferase involved in cell wall biosynthesis